MNSDGEWGGSYGDLDNLGRVVATLGMFVIFVAVSFPVLIAAMANVVRDFDDSNIILWFLMVFLSW